MTCTEGREPSGLEMVNLPRVLGDVRRYPAWTCRFTNLKQFNMPKPVVSISEILNVGVACVFESDSDDNS